METTLQTITLHLPGKTVEIEMLSPRRFSLMEEGTYLSKVYDAWRDSCENPEQIPASATFRPEEHLMPVHHNRIASLDLTDLEGAWEELSEKDDAPHYTGGVALSCSRTRDPAFVRYTVRTDNRLDRFVRLFLPTVGSAAPHLDKVARVDLIDRPEPTTLLVTPEQDNVIQF